MALTKVSSKTILDNAITADKIQSGAVTAADISDNSITVNKLHTQVQGALGTRNLLINGDMKIWQRGTSFSATGTDYTADRWQTQGQIWNGVRSTDVPDDFQYSLDITAGGSSYGTFAQKIEAVNCKHLVGKTITLSFYAKAVSGPTNCYVVFKVPGAVDNWSSSSNAAGTQNISDIGSTWTRHSFTFTNLPNTVADGLLVQIFHAPDGNTAQRRYTGFQLEAGDTATPFEHRPYDMELQRCQRYYQKIIDRDSDGTSRMWLWNISGGNLWRRGYIVYTTTMRARPTATLDATAGGGGTFVATPSFGNSGENSGAIIGDLTTGGDGYYAFVDNLYLDAEL